MPGELDNPLCRGQVAPTTSRLQVGRYSCVSTLCCLVACQLPAWAAQIVHSRGLRSESLRGGCRPQEENGAGDEAAGEGAAAAATPGGSLRHSDASQGSHGDGEEIEADPGSNAGEPAAAAEQAVRALDESEHDGDESGPSPSAGAAAESGSDTEAADLELEAEPAAAAEAVLGQAVPPGGASMAANLVSTIRSFLPMVSKPAEGQAGPAAGKQPVKVGMQSSGCVAVLHGAVLQAGRASC